MALTLLTAACGGKAPVNTFPELATRVRPGHTVYVIDTGGRETRGKVVGIAPGELTVRHDGSVQRFTADEVRQVQRYGDPLWNGAIIGLVAATPGTLLADPRYVPCEGDPRRTCSDAEVGWRAFSIGLGGLAGMGIDALIRHRRQVYVAPGAANRVVRVTPIVTVNAAGVRVTFEY